MMTYIFEVFYQAPSDERRESFLTKCVADRGGRLSFREGNGTGTICLTYEFDDLAEALTTADLLRARGEHVEGPVEYGTTAAEGTA